MLAQKNHILLTEQNKKTRSKTCESMDAKMANTAHAEKCWRLSRDYCSKRRRRSTPATRAISRRRCSSRCVEGGEHHCGSDDQDTGGIRRGRDHPRGQAVRQEDRKGQDEEPPDFNLGPRLKSRLKSGGSSTSRAW